MKAIAIIVAVLVSVLAHAQSDCREITLHGEAKQDQAFTRNIGEGITFSVEPRKMIRDAAQRWFHIVAVGDNGLITNLSDTNWIWALGTVGSASVGGPHSDLLAALGYRSRYLLFPVSVKDRVKARDARIRVSFARTAEEYRKALAAMSAVRLAHVQFDITDYALGAGNPPTSVDSVSFDAKLTLPPAFAIAGDITAVDVACPAIPDEALADIRNPNNHEFPLPKATSQPR